MAPSAYQPATLRPSPRDGALLCRVRRDGAEGGLPARFGASAQAELLLAVEETEQGPVLSLAGERRRLPPL